MPCVFCVCGWMDMLQSNIYYVCSVLQMIALWFIRLNFGAALIFAELYYMPNTNTILYLGFVVSQRRRYELECECCGFMWIAHGRTSQRQRATIQLTIISSISDVKRLISKHTHTLPDFMRCSPSHESRADRQVRCGEKWIIALINYIWIVWGVVVKVSIFQFSLSLHSLFLFVCPNSMLTRILSSSFSLFRSVRRCFF